jgi:hypothetical protein
MLCKAIANGTISAKGLFINDLILTSNREYDILGDALRKNTTLEYCGQRIFSWNREQNMFGNTIRTNTIFEYCGQRVPDIVGDIDACNRTLVSNLHGMKSLRILAFEIVDNVWGDADWRNLYAFVENTKTLERLEITTRPDVHEMVGSLGEAFKTNQSLVNFTFTTFAANVAAALTALAAHVVDWSPTLETLNVCTLWCDRSQRAQFERARAYIRIHAPHICLREILSWSADTDVTPEGTVRADDVISGVHAARERLYKAKEFKQLLELDPSHPRALFHECVHAPSEDRAQWRADALLIMQSMGRGPYADQIRALFDLE